MNPVSQALVLAGAVVALIASLGILRLPTTFARIHAGGKASPISFVLIAIGCGIELGLVGGLQLAVAAVALALTLPAATHLLFRAVHRSPEPGHLVADAHPTSPSSSSPPALGDPALGDPGLGDPDGGGADTHPRTSDPRK